MSTRQGIVPVDHASKNRAAVKQKSLQNQRQRMSELEDADTAPTVVQRHPEGSSVVNSQTR